MRHSPWASAAAGFIELKKYSTVKKVKTVEKWGLTDDYEGIGHCILGYPVSENIMPASPRKPDYCRFV